MFKRKTLWSRAIDMSNKYMELLYFFGPRPKRDDIRFYFQDAWYTGYKQGKREARKELNRGKV
jgi:hypothetical protein